jgi:3-dehydroquinate synthase
MTPSGHQGVTVELGERTYRVEIGAGLLEQAASHILPILRRPLAVVLADTTAWRLHGQRFAAALEAAGVNLHVIPVTPGEASKSFAGLEAAVNGILSSGAERTDMIVAFGGGVTGDLAGFAAGIAKRGMDFIQVPTTLLSQVDSSVGGKTGINTPAGKNMVGLFWQPRLVLADTTTLGTLDRRDIAAGWAEIFKVGLIADPAFFAWCEANRAGVLALEPAAVGEAVAHAVRAKAQVVAADEREGGVRALLNLGHTFAHALEAAADYDETVLRHGEAVGCGIALAARFSCAQGLLSSRQAARIGALVADSGLPARLGELAGIDPARLSADAMLAAMAQDKKNEDGRLTLILMRAIGDSFIDKNAPVGAVRDFLARELAGAETTP